MNQYENLRERMQRHTHLPNFQEIDNAFTAAWGAGLKIKNRGSELRKEGKLTENGISEKLRELARAETLPALKQATEMAKKLRDGAKARRDALGVKPVDKTDLVSAMLRAEIRTWLRGLDPAGVAAALVADNTPEIMTQAALELPPILIGMTPGFVDQLRDHLMKRDYAPTLEAIEEVEEAATVLDVMINFATGDMKVETGFTDVSDQQEYNAWAA